MTIEELNQEIEESGLSRYKIAKLSAINYSVLFKIRHDPNYDPKLSTVNKIREIIKKYGNHEKQT